MNAGTKRTVALGLSLLAMISLTMLISAASTGASNDTRVAEAAMKGDRETVRSLMKQGIDVNAPQGDGMTALHWAAYKDDLEMAQVLLYGGAKAGAALRIDSMTPLFFACLNGNPVMVDLLLKSGSDPNAVIKTGATPLMYAARAGNPEVVKLLLDKGAKPNTQENGRGETALMFAAAYNRSDAIKVLLTHGASPTVTSKVVDVAGRNASRGGRGQAAQIQPPPGQALPVQPAGARGPRGGAAAAGAAAANGGGGNGNEERGAAVETMGGMNALMFAARQGHMESVKALLDGGADINGIGSGDKSSPLLVAAINGHFDLAKWMLERGANPKLASTVGATPLYATINVKWALVAEYPQPEIKNEKTSYLDLMKLMLDHGADPNVRIRQELWYTGYSSSRTQIDSGGATPLWRAAQSSDVAAMKLLIARGADPKIASNNGQLPIHIAAGAGVQGNQEVTVYGTWLPGVTYLVDELKADVNARDGKGLTALHHAAGRGDNEMILYLLSRGADVTALGKNGETVADMANGPRQRIQPFAETIALLEMLGSKNSHKCVSC